jgi:hypothetical protein
MILLHCDNALGASNPLILFRTWSYDFALVADIAKPFGIGFGDLCCHAKPWFDGLLPFP